MDLFHFEQNRDSSLRQYIVVSDRRDIGCDETYQLDIVYCSAPEIDNFKNDFYLMPGIRSRAPPKTKLVTLQTYCRFFLIERLKKPEHPSQA